MFLPIIIYVPSLAFNQGKYKLVHFVFILCTFFSDWTEHSSCWDSGCSYLHFLYVFGEHQFVMQSLLVESLIQNLSGNCACLNATIKFLGSKRAKVN